MSIADFGLLSFGSSIAGIITILSDFGLSLLVQKDIPQDRFPLNKFVFNNFIFRFFIAIIVFILGCTYLFVYFRGDNISIGVIFLFNAIITAQNTFFLAVFRAKNYFRAESKSTIFYSVLILVVVAYYYYALCSIFIIAYFLLFARSVQLVILMIDYNKIFGRNNFVHDKPILIYLYNTSFYYGLQYIVGVFYFSIDLQLIAYYHGNEYLASYLSVFRIVLLMLLFNDLVSNVFLPYLSSYFSKNENYFVDFATKVHLLILVISLTMFVFLNLFARELLGIIYDGKYDSSISIVFPLSLVLLFRIPATFYAICLTISGNQNIRLLIVIVCLIFSLVFNLLLIPSFGISGAAYANLITHSVLLILYFYFSHKQFNSILANFKVIILFGLTIFIMLIKFYYFGDIPLLFSIGIMIIWLFCPFIFVDFRKIKALFYAELKL